MAARTLRDRGIYPTAAHWNGCVRLDPSADHEKLAVVLDDEDRNAPRHPDLGGRSLIAWDGYRGGIDLEVLDRRVVGAVAKPLIHAKVDAAFIERARERGFGVVLPGDAWRNQLELDHPRRRGEFSRLPYALSRPLDIGRAPFTAAFTEDYAGNYLQPQLSAGATLATTPGHVLDAEGGIARENELALAHAVSDDFIRRRAHLPPAGASHGRTLFATIVVRSKHIPDCVEWLIDAYADIRVAGYWIVVANSKRTRRELTAVTELALGLQERTKRAATVSCVGPAQLALLGHDVSATCFGHHGGTFRFPPEDWAAKLQENTDQDDTDTGGIGVNTFHREALGGVRLGEEGTPQREELFRRWPCSCGAHPKHEPPSTQAEIRAHNVRCTIADAVEICLLAPAAARGRIAERIALARRVRKAVGMGPLSSAWDGPAVAVNRREGGRGEAAAG